VVAQPGERRFNRIALGVGVVWADRFMRKNVQQCKVMQFREKYSLLYEALDLPSAHFLEIVYEVSSLTSVINRITF